MIHTIQQLRLTSRGLVARYNRHDQEIFFNQGSLDGACGPYSILMALMIIGMADSKKVMRYHVDGRTQLGKLLNLMNSNEFSALFKDGTDLYQLESLLHRSYKSKLQTESVPHRNKHVLDFTLEHLKQDRPVVMGLDYSQGSHWMLAVGYEEREKEDAIRMFFLDPAGPIPRITYWNSVVDLKKERSKKYGYLWLTNGFKVQFEQALAIWK